MKRRDVLITGMSLPFLASDFLSSTSLGDTMPISQSNRDDGQHAEFLRDVQRRCYAYFQEAADPDTGFVSDRGSTDGRWFSDHASSAACGFGLTAHSIAADAGWISREEAADKTRQMLSSLLNLVNHEHGFVYHFFEKKTGKRSFNAEVSSIDTALLVAGAMTAAIQFSDDASIVDMSDQLYRRVDWNWMLNGGELLHMGWKPETGMLPHRWDSFSELLILLLIAIGAPENAIPPECWDAWKREPVLGSGDETFLSYPPLFVHQYPMAYFDFKKFRSPRQRNYWENAVRAHHAQIDFMTELGKRWPKKFGHYGPMLWGLTSSDSVNGYRDWGGPYRVGEYKPERGIDGTVVPSAAAGGLGIVPEQSIKTLMHQRDRFGDQIYGRYGFVNAYNPATGWVGKDVIGIDTGISLLMVENRLSEGVWNSFMRHPAALRGLELAGFTPVVQ